MKKISYIFLLLCTFKGIAFSQNKNIKKERVLYIDSTFTYESDCKGCYLDKLTYTASYLIFKFRYNVKNGENDAIIIGSERSKMTWHLRQEDTLNLEYDYVRLLDLTKIRANNGTKLLPKPTFDCYGFKGLLKKENPINEISCDLIFPRPQKEECVISLIEGPKIPVLTDEMRFNFYNIELKELGK